MKGRACIFQIQIVHDISHQTNLDLSDEGLVLHLGLVQFFLKTFDRGIGLLRSLVQVLLHRGRETYLFIYSSIQWRRFRVASGGGTESAILAWGGGGGQAPKCTDIKKKIIYM